MLFLPITTPDEKRIKFHMCTKDAEYFISRIKPELTVFVHLGIVMLKHDPEAQARRTEEITGCKVIAGRDLMQLDIGKDITISDIEPRKPEWNDAWNLGE